MQQFLARLIGTFTLLATSIAALAAPTVSRLTPPSELFASGNAAPVIARFLPGQRFDVQATLRPDEAGKTITAAQFFIDGKALAGVVALKGCEAGACPTCPPTPRSRRCAL
jgi:alkaline phosphatase